jgi:hypothetical protein
MEYNYQPLSEEEAQRKRYKLMDDGIYQATIEHAEGKLSSSNNPMGVFYLRVWDKSGHPKEIKDYIPFIDSMMWKLRHLADASKLIKEFEDRKFRPELAIGKEVYVNIKTQSGKEIPLDKLNGKAPGAKYPDKNVVDDYVVKESSDNKAESKGHADLPFDDDLDSIPF